MTTRKITVKQEKFCQVYMETGNASEAYRRAYPTSQKWPPNAVTINASQLLKNANVALRVKTLADEALKRHEITVDTLVDELEEARQLAKKTEAPASMVSATMGKGKLLGLVVEKNEHTGKDGGPIETADITDIEAARRVAFMLGQAVTRKRNASVS